MIKKVLLLLQLMIGLSFSLEINPYFKTDAEIYKFYVDSSVKVPDEGRDGFRIDKKNGHIIAEIGNTCLCREDWGGTVVYDWDSDSIIGGEGYMLGIEFGDGSKKPSFSKEKYERAKIASRNLICKFVRGNISANHSKALREFKENKNSGDAAFISKDIVEYVMWIFYPITNENVSIYNDLGFFLEQGKEYQYAVTLLEQVIKAVPSRTVAYVNLGDAYWGLKKVDEAKKCYVTYIDLMKKEGKENKIPSVVLDRLK